MRSLFAALLVAAVAACAPVRTLPLTSPAAEEVEGLRLGVSAVSPSDTFLVQRGGGLSVVAMTVTIHNRGGQTRTVHLDRATLTLADPGGELPEIALPASLGGDGAAPELVPLGSRPLAITVSPGQSIVAWVGFRRAEPIDEADLPRRIVLRVPVEGLTAPVDLVLAEPATARPRWVHEPIKHASYAGIHAAGTFDEASFGIVRLSPKSAAGPLVFGPSIGIGFRGGELRGEPRSAVSCCDLSTSFDASAQLLRNRGGSAGPYLGYHALFALDSGRPDRATWHGPSAGIRLFSVPIAPRHAGAFPVRTPPSVLGYTSVTIAYVHWFRRGDEGGSPGGILVLEHTTPPW